MLELQHISVPSKLVDRLHKSGSCDREALFANGENYDEGQFYLLQASDNPKHSVLCVAQGEKVQRIQVGESTLQGIRPRDVRQKCLLWSISNKALTVGLGAAGTGKTTIAIAYALQQLFRNEKTIVLTKPTMFVGGSSNAVAAVPGDIHDKLRPYVESYMLIMRKLLGDDAEHFVAEFLEKGKLIIQPLELVRGMNFDNAVVILDEAQNTTTHELLSFISRVSETSSCIVLGDPAQVDTDLAWRETGLCQLLKSDTFYDSLIAKGIKLEAQYRGPLADLAAHVLEELNGDDED